MGWNSYKSPTSDFRTPPISVPLWFLYLRLLSGLLFPRSQGCHCPFLRLLCLPHLSPYCHGCTAVDSLLFPVLCQLPMTGVSSQLSCRAEQDQFHQLSSISGTQQPSRSTLWVTVFCVDAKGDSVVTRWNCSKWQMGHPRQSSSHCSPCHVGLGHDCGHTGPRFCPSPEQHTVRIWSTTSRFHQWIRRRRVPLMREADDSFCPSPAREHLLD